MVNTLNIKTLAKGMRVEDKAKLIFADRNKRAETSGKEGLLTPEEEKALIEDAQDLNQIKELNRLNTLYRLASFMYLDIQTACMQFQLSERLLTTVLTGLVLVGEANDALNAAVFELTTKGYDDKQLEDKEVQDAIDKKANDFRKNFKRGGLSKNYDYFEPHLREGSYFSTDPGSETSQPNTLLQMAFMKTIRDAKGFKKQVFQWKYVESKAGFDLLGERERERIDGFIEEINQFINLEGPLCLVTLYVEFLDKGLLKYTNIQEPKFITSVRDMKKVTRLGKNTKEIARKEIDEAINKHQ